jgi:hypothetical protein
MPEWYLKPGDTVERVKLHEDFGGRTQGGIGPSIQTPNVFVFSDPASGEQYGYIDAWREDGCFHYTGEGQRGDQQMKSGNKAIREHATAEPGVTEVSIEEQWTEKAFVNPTREEFEIERREQKLVRQYMTYLKREGHDVCRHKIVAPGEAKPLFTDLYDSTTATLVEAKGSVRRESIRMAVGQLADYRRHIGNLNELAVLLPSEPRPDLLDLLKSQSITAIWPDGNAKFVTAAGAVDARRA